MLRSLPPQKRTIFFGLYFKTTSLANSTTSETRELPKPRLIAFRSPRDLGKSQRRMLELRTKTMTPAFSAGCRSDRRRNRSRSGACRRDCHTIRASSGPRRTDRFPPIQRPLAGATDRLPRLALSPARAIRVRRRESGNAGHPRPLTPRLAPKNNFPSLPTYRQKRYGSPFPSGGYLFFPPLVSRLGGRE